MIKEEDLKRNKVQYGVLQWGPCIVRFKIPIDVQLLLLKEGKASKEDASPDLAGLLDKEVYFRNKNKFEVFFENCFSLYNHAYGNWKKDAAKNPSKYFLEKLWCNFQGPNEFNPPHTHTGALSFVIYLQIPEELKNENQKYRGKSAGPGGITFLYGDSGDTAGSYAICNHSFFPEERDMIIFPAWVKHWVYPYKSNCTRISTSGNVIDNIPLNRVETSSGWKK